MPCLSTAQVVKWARVQASSCCGQKFWLVLKLTISQTGCYRCIKQNTEGGEIGRICDLLTSGFSVLLLSGILAVVGVLNACARDLKTCFSFK
jgi:hypothetical protein